MHQAVAALPIGHSAFVLSAFGDEIDDVVDTQLDTGYRGFLALEPHLANGAEGMKRAARALRSLMEDAGCTES